MPSSVGMRAAKILAWTGCFEVPMRVFLLGCDEDFAETGHGLLLQTAMGCHEVNFGWVRMWMGCRWDVIKVAGLPPTRDAMKSLKAGAIGT